MLDSNRAHWVSDRADQRSCGNRNYMAQDIMRRILRDYFGYEVQFVMNITDVDDKVKHTAVRVWMRNS